MKKRKNTTPKLLNEHCPTTFVNTKQRRAKDSPSSVLRGLKISLSSGFVVSSSKKKKLFSKIRSRTALLLPCPSAGNSKEFAENSEPECEIQPTANRRSTSLSLASNFPEVLRFYKSLTSKKHLLLEKKHYINSVKRNIVLDKTPLQSNFLPKTPNSYTIGKSVNRASSDTTSSQNHKPKLHSINFKIPTIQTASYTRRRTPFNFSVGWGASPRINALTSNHDSNKTQRPIKSASSVNLDIPAPSIKCPHCTVHCDSHPTNTVCISEPCTAMKPNRPYNPDSGKNPLRSSYCHPSSQHQMSSNFNIPLSLSAVSHSPPISSSVPNSATDNEPPLSIELPAKSSFHSGPLESLHVVSPHQNTMRQQTMIGSPRQQRKLIDRQKLKMLKPLSMSKAQSSVNKLYDISTSEFSAAILPDSGTSSYRLKHDVSFDEGSRYRNTTTENYMLSQTETKNNKSSPNPSRKCWFRMGRHLCNMPSPAQVSFKETMPLSLIRMEDRLNEIPMAAANSPVTPTSANGLSPYTGAVNQKQGGESPVSGTITTFRLHKGKSNWNCKLGELSINGGGFYNASSTRESATYVVNGNPDSGQMQRSIQIRERNTTVLKSRMSSRFMKMDDLKCKDKEVVYQVAFGKEAKLNQISNELSSLSAVSTAYATSTDLQDPCIGAAPSFQQRLTDLSLLESETVKYERTRRLRRKKNQDKDS